jgi:hypothetical protein
MPFYEDLSLFFSDFAVSAVFGSETAKVLVDVPNSYDLDSQVVVGETKITYPHTVLTTLKAGNQITVDGKSYKVKSVLKIDDGKLVQACVVAL